MLGSSLPSRRSTERTGATTRSEKEGMRSLLSTGLSLVLLPATPFPAGNETECLAGNGVRKQGSVYCLSDWPVQW